MLQPLRIPSCITSFSLPLEISLNPQSGEAPAPQPALHRCWGSSVILPLQGASPQASNTHVSSLSALRGPLQKDFSPSLHDSILECPRATCKAWMARSHERGLKAEGCWQEQSQMIRGGVASFSYGPCDYRDSHPSYSILQQGSSPPLFFARYSALCLCPHLTMPAQGVCSACPSLGFLLPCLPPT